jgi:hypothetical protein
MVEHRDRFSSDDPGEWVSQNNRIGGYKCLKRAISALKSRSANGRILNEERKIVVLIQAGKQTFPLV